MPIDFPDRIAGFPFLPVEFDKHAHRVDEDQVAGLIDHVRSDGVINLLVVSHGWNNDEAEALSLYEALLASIRRRAGTRLDTRKVAVLGVFWPSKKFADEELIPGGAASFDTDLPEDALIAQIEASRGLFADDALDELRELAPQLENSPAARTRFGDIVRALLDDDVTDDEELGDEIPDEFFEMPGEEILHNLSAPRDEEVAGGGAGGVVPVGGLGGVGGVGGMGDDQVGGAAGIGDLLRGIRSGAAAALNLVTYWKMKRRAGQVGKSGLAPVLREVRAAAPNVKFHLVGHSFGGRLMAASALGENDRDPALPVSSMTLLQAAFSHNGFAENWEGDKDGYFSDVFRNMRVSGPTLVTFTSNDRANRWAYPMASRLARQKAAAFGGPDDVYGAIGANGAQKTPGSIDGVLLAKDGSYTFQAGKIHNLKASEFISDHGDVTGDEVGQAIVSAMLTT